MLDMSRTYHIGRFLILESLMEPEPEAKKTKRGANPTMRDKTAQAAGKTNKPTRKGRVGRTIAKPFRPIGRLLVRIERFKPVHILGLIIVPRYFRNSWRELRMVVWPSRRETRRLTSAVLIFAVIFGIMIAIVDYGLDKVFKKVILKQ
jgi:preprotein translocase subunit SecE